MKQIKLTKGKSAIVDDEDFEWLNKWKWHLHTSSGKMYAKRTIYPKNKNILPHHTRIKKDLLLHRVVMNYFGKKDIDHIDGNGLNNKKNNLRICSHSTNLRNCKTPSTNTSGYKGVCWHNNRWEARMKVNGKIINFGNFNNKDKAIESIKKAFNDYFNVGA